MMSAALAASIVASTAAADDAMTGAARNTTMQSGAATPPNAAAPSTPLGAVPMTSPDAVALASSGVPIAVATTDGMSSGPPGQVTSTTTAPAPRRQFGVGYYRGTGLDYYGASLAMAWTSTLTSQVHVFGFFDEGSRGFAIAPAIKRSFNEGSKMRAFIAGGVQYLRMWFGDATGGGFGAYGTVGCSVTIDPFELELGVGIHLKQTIRGSEGAVTVEQPPNFGPHWDAGLRYWF